LSVLLVPVASPLHDPEAVGRVWGRYLGLLRGVVDGVIDSLITKPEDVRGVPKADAYVVAVLTGGSEGLILELHRRFGVPMALVAHETQNSLAASLEASAGVGFEGGYAEVFLLTNELPKELLPFIKACKAVSRVRGSKVLLVGDPSPWLIYSSRQLGAAEELLKVSITKVGIDELIKYLSRVSEGEVLSIAKSVINSSLGLEGVGKDDVVKASRLYVAIKSLMNYLGTELMSIRCFDLLKYGVTACLALSLLNSEGYVAACEGDLPALMTMALMRYLSGEAVFMGNIDWVRGDEVLIAHCTAPTKLLKGYRLRTHFESGISVGIEGYLRRGEVVTIARLDLIRGVLRVGTGEVINESPVSPYVCRTQYLIKLMGNAEALIKDSIGNHYVITKGSLLKELKYVAKILNLKYEVIT